MEYLAELALGALSGDEAAAVRAHLAGCSDCAAEYEEMARVASLLPLAAEDVAPPAGIKESVFARIAQDRPPTAAPAGIRSPRAVPVRWLGGIAAGIALLLVAGGAIGFALRGDGSEAGLKATASLQARALQAAAQGTLKVAHGEQGGASASVLIAPGVDQVFAVMAGLPPLPSGKAYQAWFTKDGATFEPSRVFTTAEGGAWLPAAGDADAYAAMGLTIEDAGGATAPSSAPFIVVDFTKSVRAR